MVECRGWFFGSLERETQGVASNPPEGWVVGRLSDRNEVVSRGSHVSFQSLTIGRGLLKRIQLGKVQMGVGIGVVQFRKGLVALIDVATLFSIASKDSSGLYHQEAKLFWNVDCFSIS